MYTSNFSQVNFKAWSLTLNFVSHLDFCFKPSSRTWFSQKPSMEAAQRILTNLRILSWAKFLYIWMVTLNRSDLWNRSFSYTLFARSQLSTLYAHRLPSRHASTSNITVAIAKFSGYRSYYYAIILEFPSRMTGDTDRWRGGGRCGELVYISET